MITLDDVVLPDDIIWSDELFWNNQVQSTEYSIDGSLVIQSGIKQKGRTITLEGDDNTAWIKRSTALILQLKQQVLGAEYTLTWVDGRVFTVIFQAFEATPIYHLVDPSLDHIYKVKINLIEV